MVDCVKKVTFGVKNIFLYVNTTSQTIIGKIVENDMYVGFTTITKRKMFIFESDDFRYLARSYFEHGVDQAHKHNTYMEVMTFNDPMKPRTIKVIDRSFLHE